MTIINPRPGTKMQAAKLQLGERKDGGIFLTMVALGDGAVGIEAGDDAIHVDADAFRELAQWAVTVALGLDPMSRGKS
jgi:hypothetical protein